MRENTVIIIPTLNPTKSLIDYIDQLIDNDFENIIVVNDGSDSSCDSFFLTIAKKKECHVITHAKNCGKGRALKNAFNYYLINFDNTQFAGVITVDSDGQHSIEDVIKMSRALIGSPQSLILGSRDFTQDDIPFMSKMGNKITCKVFALLHGSKLKDTQTGLRAIPTVLLGNYLDIAGERFDYETNMLIVTAMKKISFLEVDINTVYIDENKGTHFNPIRDSIAIYKVLFSTFIKYSIASLSSFVLDIAFFQFLIMLLEDADEKYKIWFSTVLARLISSLYNYVVNKNIVFKKNGKHKYLWIKYYCLCLIQMACSASLVLIFYKVLGIPETVVKLLADTVLFVISYRIQKYYIFK